MTPAIPDDSTLSRWIICAVVVGLPLAWTVWRYVRAARSPRPDEPRDRLNWLRAMYPDHAALPEPAPRAPMLPTPRGWSAGRVLIYAAQAGAIGWLTWSIITSVDPVADREVAKGLGLAPFLALVVVAFATAVLTNLWAWAHGELQRLPVRVGLGFRALRRAVTPRPALQRHPGDAPEALRARRLGREAPEG